MPSVEILTDKLPSDDNLERHLIGRILLEPDDFTEISDIATPNLFVNDVYKTIFEAIIDLVSNGKPVNEIAVILALQQTKQLEYCGGAYGISEVATNISFREPIKTVCLYLEELSMRRKTIEHGLQLIKKSFDLSEDIFETVGLASEFTDVSIMNFHSDKSMYPEYRMTETINKIIEARNSKGMTGIPSGLNGLDNNIGGWQNGDLIIIAGRPGMGKSALIFNLMHNAADAGYPVAVFEMEMMPVQVGMREVSMINRIPYSKIKRGQVTMDELRYIAENVSETIINKKIYFEWRSSVSIQYIRSKLIKMKHELGIKIAMIDYLNLMQVDKGGSKNREREIAEVVEGLKSLAKDLNIPIILCAQLNRDNEKMTDKKPSLHHLRDSGAIEQAADIVLLLFRPEYYLRESPFDANGNSLKNLLVIDVAKNKQGGTGDQEFDCFIEINQIKDKPNNMIPVSREVQPYTEDNPF